MKRNTTLASLTALLLPVLVVPAVAQQYPFKSLRLIVPLAPGGGTLLHLSMELLKSMADIDLVHVPYKGGGPAMTDLIGG